MFSTLTPASSRRFVPPALVVRAIEVIQAYDLMRARTYRARPGNPNAIEIRRFGEAVATRFPAVGYFNQVYNFREEDIEHLPALRAFYAEAGLGFKVHVAPDTERGRVFAALADDGLRMVEHLARYVAPATAIQSRRCAERVHFEPLLPDRVTAFFKIYLTCFGAPRAGHEAAIENMRLLPRQPSIHCHFARVGWRVAGLSMLYVHGRTACLCAGAVLPAFRGAGVQMAAIRHRARLARALGCTNLVSWTEGGSYSGRNLERAGFRLALVDPVWFCPPPGGRVS